MNYFKTKSIYNEDNEDTKISNTVEMLDTNFTGNFTGTGNIKINNFLIDRTLKSSPVSINFSKKVTELKTQCRGDEVLKNYVELSNIEAEFTISYDSDILDFLEQESGFSFNSDKTFLKDVNVKFKSNNTIEFLRCNLILEKKLNFKSDLISEIKVKVKVLKQKNNGNYFKLGGDF